MRIAFKNDQHIENDNFDMKHVAEAFNSSSVDVAYLVDKSKKQYVDIDDIVELVDAVKSQEFHSRTLGLS